MTFPTVHPPTRRSDPLAQCAGFTLVEMLVVLAMMGILTGIAIPSVMAWMPAKYLKDSAKDIQGAMYKARSLAINNGLEYRVMFNTATGLYQVDRGDAMTHSTVWNPVTAPLPLAIGIGVQNFGTGMESVRQNEQFLRFGTNGQVVGNVDTFTVHLNNSHGDTYRLDLKRRTGHVALVKGG